MAMARQRNFGGKTVVITGAAGGLGGAFSRCFADAGATLGLLDLNAERLREATAALRARGVACVDAACDITDEDACRTAMATVLDRFGGIDVLVNNAGITHRSAFADTDTAVFRRVMAVNFFGALHCTKAALPSLMARRGLIVVVSSIAGIAPLYGRSGYAASKHALHGLFASLRTELRAAGVDVTIVCPGFTATGLTTAALDGDGSITRHPQSTVGRIASPAAVAQAVVRAAAQRKRLLVLSAAGQATHVLNRAFPALYERLMMRALRRELQRA
jgi:NAD(P)-dependent dehydrogenase (short-subunit alcohol dehydrogenase family)